MKTKRKIIEIDEERCDGCGQCVIACAEGALEIIDGKARLVSEVYCDGLGACIGECPQDAIRIIDREAEEFDPEAVEEYLKQKEQQNKQQKIVSPSCPSSQLHTFQISCEQANEPVSQSGEGSSLGHWPVQIRLIPPIAPFLQRAHILVAADCVPVAYPYFHRDFLKGKVVLIGCPKFDDMQEYLERFTEIFKRADIQSTTVLTMEVPCCSGLPGMVRKAMELAGARVPMEEIVISARGNILERKKSAA